MKAVFHATFYTCSRIFSISTFSFTADFVVSCCTIFLCAFFHYNMLLMITSLLNDINACPDRASDTAFNYCYRNPGIDIGSVC